MTDTNKAFRYEYVVGPQAWYYSANPHDRGIVITKANRQGGCFWEFEVDQVELYGDNHLKILMFEDAFPALAELPELFAALAAEQPRTLDQLIELLNRHGLVDATPRRRPRS